MKVRTLSFASIAVTIVVLWAAAHSQERRFELAEEAARDYMAAFLTGDIAVAAALTHPDTLERMRALILGELDGPMTPADFGLSLSLDEIRELSAEAFYVAFVEADRGSSPDAAEAMRAARVEVIGSREASNGAVAVQLRMLTPNGLGGFAAQEAEFFLRSTGEAWKVVADESQQ